MFQRFGRIFDDASWIVKLNPAARLERPLDEIRAKSRGWKGSCPPQTVTFDASLQRLGRLVYPRKLDLMMVSRMYTIPPPTNLI